MPVTRLAGEHLRPLGQLSAPKRMRIRVAHNDTAIRLQCQIKIHGLCNHKSIGYAVCAYWQLPTMHDELMRIKRIA